jgi:glycerate 2-kinase
MADLKEVARRIFQKTLAAIDIPATMRRKLRREGSLIHCSDAVVDLRVFETVRIVAIGKAAHAMVDGLTELLPEVALEGVVAAPTVPARAVRGMKYFVAGHPVPNEASWKAGETILEMLGASNERTLVFFLVSGGASALMEVPLDPAQSLGDVQQLHRVLVTCGAPIQAINAVRKHVSAVKGGRLAVAAGRATKITLAITDVPVGHETALGSGPTLADVSTLGDVEKVIEEYGLGPRLPSALRRWIGDRKMAETPKKDHAAFANAHFLLLLGMDDLFHPAHHAAEANGFVTCCDNVTDDWPVERAADYLLGQLEELRRANSGRCVAVIADGEVSSPVIGSGVGGRNSAFVLACVERIAGKRVAVLSAGTDGIDGNSPAAGAVADGETLERARAAGLDPQRAFGASDAYTFFAGLGDAIVTGPTGNNLRDLRILIAEA